MKRWLFVERTLVGTPRAIVGEICDHLPELLQTATGSPVEPPHGDGGVDLKLQATEGSRHVTKTVRAHVGQAVRTEGEVAIPLRWAAHPAAHLFPTFSGHLEVETSSRISVAIKLVGQYEPPLGPVGQAIDVLVLDDTAHRTGRWLLGKLTMAITARLVGMGEDVSAPVGQLLVRDVMSADPLVFSGDESLRTAAGVLLAKGVSGAPVVDDQGTVIGVVSQRDLLDKVAAWRSGLGRAVSDAHRRHRGRTVVDVCTQPARVTEADTPLREAAAEMARHDVDRLVVLDGGNFVGIITRSDVLKALIRDQEVIREAIDAVLARAAADDVEVTYRNDEVVLTGQTTLRSSVRDLQLRLEEIDGIAAVDSRALSWQVDDVMPPPTPRF